MIAAIFCVVFIRAQPFITILVRALSRHTHNFGLTDSHRGSGFFADTAEHQLV